MYSTENEQEPIIKNLQQAPKTPEYSDHDKELPLLGMKEEA